MELKNDFKEANRIKNYVFRYGYKQGNEYTTRDYKLTLDKSVFKIHDKKGKLMYCYPYKEIKNDIKTFAWLMFQHI